MPCGRWGGEEFLLLLPETVLADALPLIERLRGALRELRVMVGEQRLAITASFGVAEYRAPEGYSQVLNRADAALLEAKRSGRDRCMLAGEWEAGSAYRVI